jgi:undecaprenyl-diphosphatase
VSDLERRELTPATGPRRSFVYGAAIVLLLVSLVLAAARVGDLPGRLSDWQAFALGITQGLTELLPISSSGHLILVPWLGDWHYLETHDSFNKTFDVALHLGTLVAVVAYFWTDVSRLTIAAFRSLGKRRIENEDERLVWYVLAASVPAALAGAVGEHVFESHFGDPWQIAIFLAVFGVLLWVADRRPQEYEVPDLTFRKTLTIGVSEILALMPGVSRSGITITTGRFLGLTRDAAARFSFLMLVPIVLGAVLYTGLKHIVLEPLPGGSGGPFLVGVLASAGAGLVAIELLLGYVRRHSYTPFVIYRLVVAAIIVILIATGAYDATF